MRPSTWRITFQKRYGWLQYYIFRLSSFLPMTFNILFSSSIKIFFVGFLLLCVSLWLYLPISFDLKCFTTSFVCVLKVLLSKFEFVWFSLFLLGKMRIDTLSWTYWLQEYFCNSLYGSSLLLSYVAINGIEDAYHGKVWILHDYVAIILATLDL